MSQKGETVVDAVPSVGRSGFRPTPIDIDEDGEPQNCTYLRMQIEKLETGANPKIAEISAYCQFEHRFEQVKIEQFS